MVKSVNRGRWTAEEHKRFVQAREKRMKWEQIAEFVETRSADQCRSHNQKMKIQKINSRGTWALMCSLKMVDKSTQYEVPLSFYTSRPVYVNHFEIESQLTKASEINEYSKDDFDDIVFDCCDHFFSNEH